MQRVVWRRSATAGDHLRQEYVRQIDVIADGVMRALPFNTLVANDCRQIIQNIEKSPVLPSDSDFSHWPE